MFSGLFSSRSDTAEQVQKKQEYFGKEYQSRVIINSANRSNGTSSNFQIEIPSLIIRNSTHVVCLAAYIPLSYYMVVSGNYFTLDEDGTEVSIQISPGNYTRQSFASSLTAALNAASPNSLTYTITYPKINNNGDDGKYAYSVTAYGGAQPIFKFSAGKTNGNFFEFMGFTSGQDYQFAGNSLRSVNVVKIAREDTLFIRSNLVDGINDNVLQEIYSTSTGSFGAINFQQIDCHLYRNKITSAEGNIFNFFLTDENGNSIDLNGQNWLLTLGFI